MSKWQIERLTLNVQVMDEMKANKWACECVVGLRWGAWICGK